MQNLNCKTQNVKFNGHFFQIKHRAGVYLFALRVKKLIEFPIVKGGYMTDVKCTISNCEYWGSNNMCVANQILVAAGPPESQEHHSPVMQESLMETPVQDDIQTHCHTFEAR